MRPLEEGSWGEFRRLQIEQANLSEQGDAAAERLGELRQRISELYFGLLGTITPSNVTNTSTAAATYPVPEDIHAIAEEPEVILDAYHSMVRAYCSTKSSDKEAQLQRAGLPILKLAQASGASIDIAAMQLLAPDDFVREVTTVLHTSALFPRKRVYFPAILGTGIRPSFNRGSITSGWTRHEGIGKEPVWSCEVAWEENGLPAVFFDRYAFIDPAKRMKQSKEQFAGMMRRENRFGATLASLLQHNAMTLEDYDAQLEAPRLLAEEVQHMRDRQKINAYKARRPETDEADAVASTLLARTATHFVRLRQELAHPMHSHIATLSILEFSAQIGSLLKLMQNEIAANRHGAAFAHFLNYANIAETLRQPALQAQSMAFDPRSVEGAYIFASHRALQDMPVKQHTADAIVEACFEKPQHPALTAYDLLSASYRKNIS